MKLQLHPFNDNYGINSITESTVKLILGTFPAYQVTSNQNPRINFYYGSTDNKFWDLFKDVKNPNLILTANDILSYLMQEGFGIIDIIRSCYRQNNSSSADEDLTIIDQQNMIQLLRNSRITEIYATSNLVTSLMKKQILPLLSKEQKLLKRIAVEQYDYEQILLPASIFKVERTLKIVTLFSPSDNALRGIKKGLNARKLKIDPTDYRLNQYRQLLK